MGPRDVGPGDVGLVRVTVASATRRVDLALPGAVPVAELVPGLARSLGVLDAGTVHGGYRLVTRDGRRLDAESGLTVQGVEDGCLVALAAGVDDARPRVYDDVVEAAAEVVARDVPPWEAAAARRTASAAAVLLLLAGLPGVVLQHGSDLAAAVAGAVAVLLVAVAVAPSREPRDAAVAVVVAWTGCAYAAAAGLVLGWGSPFLGTPVAAAGAGVLAAGLVAATGPAGNRALLLPPVVAGTVFLATALLTRASPYDPAVVLTATLTLVVSAGSVFPWVALTTTAPTLGRHLAVADPDEPGEIDAERVRADVLVVHETLVALSASVGLLLVLVAPVAVSLGPAGALVAVLACGVLMLGTRQYAGAAAVLCGLASGTLGLVSTSLSVLCLLPSWRPATALALGLSGVVLLAATLLTRGAPVRRRRLGDLAETIALLALPSALVVATGVLGRVPG